MTLGVIIGHREVFPGILAEQGRKKILEILHGKGIETVILDEKATKYGAVSCLADSRKYAELFSQNRNIIDGILISLPDFGDETSITHAVKDSGLNVPVYVHAWADKSDSLDIKSRRDSFCGKFSTCNNLKQLGVKFTIGERHVIDPDSDYFSEEIDRFLGICRVVNGLSKARIGCIGARTSDFKTVRFSEKLLQNFGITVETIDLSEMIADALEIKPDSERLKERIELLNDYVLKTGEIPEIAVTHMSQLSLAVEDWVKKSELDAYAIQCWPSMQRGIHIFPCIFMSFMSDHGLPSACETDVMGAVSMLALQLASGEASALFDLNNNWEDNLDQMLLFHCSNCPVSLMEKPKANFNAMAVKGEGIENSYGTLSGFLKEGDYTYARLTTDDLSGKIRSYIGEGLLIEKEFETFGTAGVFEIKNLQALLKYLCMNGFEHHVAINRSKVANILEEAFTNYLGWEVYHHTD